MPQPPAQDQLVLRTSMVGLEPWLGHSFLRWKQVEQKRPGRCPRLSHLSQGEAGCDVTAWREPLWATRSPGLLLPFSGKPKEERRSHHPHITDEMGHEVQKGRGHCTEVIACGGGRPTDSSTLGTRLSASVPRHLSTKPVEVCVP